ncbi:MAG: kinase [Lachnospiraceae bacterium]|nr:kinase [Lachnospiraceae bacterium]
MAYLEKIQVYLKEQGWEYRYSEEDGCGSIDFDYRGVPYHIWEFDEGERGVETNLRHGGRQEEFYGDYETALIALMEEWKQN